jgi:hypothetical protein
VVFARDKSNTKKWFMCIADKNDMTAFEIQESHNSSASNGSRELARTILACFDNNRSMRFLVPAEPETIQDKKYYVLIPIEEPANREIKRRKPRGGGKS